MYGSIDNAGTAPGSIAGDVDGAVAPARLARWLADEFGAPVGLLDLPSGAWLVTLGAPADAFPVVDPAKAGPGAALGVGAVAWFPGHHAEGVVSGGEVGALNEANYRALLPNPKGDPVRYVNEPVGAPDPAIRRMIAVSADSQGSFGWLIALNPTD